MTKSVKFFTLLSILVLLFAPAVSFADHEGKPHIVPYCDKPMVDSQGQPVIDLATKVQKRDYSCGWSDFLKLVNSVISFIFKSLVLPIAGIMFAWAGFLLVTSGGSENRKSEAKKIFTNVALGLILAAAAWLIVNTVLYLFSPADYWAWIGFK